MSLPSYDEIMSVLRDDAGVLNTSAQESFFTSGMSSNLSEMIARVGSGGDFTVEELAVFEKQAEDFATLCA
ncbi:MAG: hypothetical protein WC091_11760 [Sulfuricellaceae bacterium]